MLTDHAGRPRIVVTGYGAITCLGLDADTTWNNLVAGNSGIRRIQSFDVSDMPITIAGEIQGFDPEKELPADWVWMGDRFTQIGMAATQDALRHAGLDPDNETEMQDVAVLCANAHGHLAPWGTSAFRIIQRVGSYDAMDQFELYENMFKYVEETQTGGRHQYDRDLARVFYNHPTHMISARLRSYGPAYTTSSACMSGAKSIDRAARLLRHGHAQVALAGGSEACVARYAVFSLHAMKALTTDDAVPDKASRPFDKNRSGFVLAEGAGIVTLETLEHAMKRGAEIHAELVGIGSSANAFSMYAPEPVGEGPAGSMKASLRDANIAPEDVDCIFAHATATGIGDPGEADGLRMTFGEEAKIPITAPKSMMGHAIAASGAIAAINSIQAIKAGAVPPVLNLTDPDEECVRGLHIVTGEAESRDIKIAVSNAFGFGGTNCTNVFRRFED